MPNNVHCPHSFRKRVLDGLQDLFLSQSECAIVRVHGRREQEDDLVLFLGVGVAAVARDTVNTADAAAAPVRQSCARSLSLTIRAHRGGYRVVSVEAVVEMLDAVHDVPEREGQDLDPAIGVLAAVVLCDHVLGHIPVVDKDDAAIAVQERCTGLDLREVIVAWSKARIG